jgi:mono/diheme cytochrome c family protein
MSILECNESYGNRSELKKRIPVVENDSFDFVIDSLTKLLCLTPNDLSLAFDRVTLDGFNEGATTLKVLILMDLVDGLGDAKSKQLLPPIERMKEQFGANYECVDALGGAHGAIGRSDHSPEVCDHLEAQQRLLDQTSSENKSAEGATCKVQSAFEDRAHDILKSATGPMVLGPEAVQRGRKVAQDVCQTCHGNPARQPKRLFFNGEGSTRSKLESDPNFLDDVIKRIHNSSDPMPPFDSDRLLDDREKTDLIAYLQHLKATN